MNHDYYEGKRNGVRLYAWWKDGVQYVGITGRTLEWALKDIDETEKQGRKAFMNALQKRLDRISKMETF